MRLFGVIFFALLTRGDNSFCKLLESKSNNDKSNDMSMTEGGIFIIYNSFMAILYQCKIMPLKITLDRELKHTHSMTFTTEEIKINSKLLILGNRIYYACKNIKMLGAAWTTVPGQENRSRARVQALKGHPSSGSISTASKTIAPLHISLISYMKTSKCLSDGNRYTWFFRMVPSDCFHINPLVVLLKPYGWTWFGFVSCTNVYSEFTKIARKEGIYIEYMTQYLNTTLEKTVLLSPKTMKTYFRGLFGITECTTGIQWIGIEAWIQTRDLVTVGMANILQILMSSAITECHTAGLQYFWLNMQTSDNTFPKDYWDKHLSENYSMTPHGEFSPMSQRGVYNDISMVTYQSVCFVDSTVHTHHKQTVSTYSICPNRNYSPLKQVPRSVCRRNCPTKIEETDHCEERRQLCFFMLSIKGKMSNQPGVKKYFPYILETAIKADNNRSITHIGILGWVLSTLLILGLFLTAAVAVLILQNAQNIPIVRANNSELSFLLLFSLTLCFLCSLTFIGRASHWSCMLRHTAFGITFVLCISCVLGKTIVVLMAFRATLPGSNVMKWFGPPQQMLSVLVFTLIQVLICLLWLTLSPPFLNINMKYYKDKPIPGCAVGLDLGFSGVLEHTEILPVLCLLTALLIHVLYCGKAKLLSLSILIYCVMWTAFIELYVRSLAKYMVMSEIISVLS
ncbi:extracellular calcium-sensing receptor-like [Brienomyrus brachyistius]|uniref:extracellular calcium-sensing receptor-like n=1 Tax=Brienomyrus brachyistius TaxID=42636 RepID=UPI0020B18658|nr:extracellular calcium-sensing receptor-like [Brienomyrus brachyistius]